MKLPKQVAAEGFRLRALDTIDSTNSEAMRLARSGDRGRLWVSAQEQTAGRGRLSRPWDSVRGNFFASLLLVDEVAPDRAPQLGFVTGVALMQALREILPAAPQLKLKWPNDLLANGAKVAGILLEGSMLPEGRFACVIGCGVNCVQHPRDTSYPATDFAALGIALSPDDLLFSFSSAMAQSLDRWRGPDGFDITRHAWLEDAAGLNQPITVCSPAAPQSDFVSGIFRRIDDSGCMVLETPEGRRTVSAGDVLLLDSAAKDKDLKSKQPKMEGPHGR